MMSCVRYAVFFLFVLMAGNASAATVAAFSSGAMVRVALTSVVLEGTDVNAFRFLKIEEPDFDGGNFRDNATGSRSIISGKFGGTVNPTGFFWQVNAELSGKATLESLYSTGRTYSAQDYKFTYLGCGVDCSENLEVTVEYSASARANHSITEPTVGSRSASLADAHLLGGSLPRTAFRARGDGDSDLAASGIASFILAPGDVLNFLTFAHAYGEALTPPGPLVPTDDTSSTVVPLPAGLPLLVAALGGLCLLRRRVAA